jgi:ABC-2 type transport system permease protein
LLLTEILSKRDVLATLVEKDFKSRYKAKALGRLWSVADPLVMVVIYTIASPTSCRWPSATTPSSCCWA